MLRNRVITGTTIRITAQNTFNSVIQARYRPTRAQRLNHKAGTRRFVATTLWQHRTDEPLVDFHQENERVGKNKSYGFHNDFS